MSVRLGYDVERLTLSDLRLADVPDALVLIWLLPPLVSTLSAVSSVLGGGIVPLIVAAPLLLCSFAWFNSEPRCYRSVMQRACGKALSQRRGVLPSGLASGVRT
jgi:hypothetical protein